MWWKEYEDVRPDDSLIQERVEPGNGIVGCEMHGLYGWGERYSHPPTFKRKGVLAYFQSLFSSLFSQDRR